MLADENKYFAAETGEAPKAPARAGVVIRNTRPTDIADIRELQQRVYPTILAWTEAQMLEQLRHFPDGQFVAEAGGRVVGAASSLVVQWDDYAVNHTWEEVTGNGTFSTHDRAGRTLYGAEVVVSPAQRGNGVGRALYHARAQLCRRLSLRRIIAAGRIPGYRAVRDKMTPELYAMRVVWGDIADPVLRFQMSQGYHYCGIVHGYLPEDHESCGHAALIVWLNSREAPARPRRSPPARIL